MSWTQKRVMRPEVNDCFQYFIARRSETVFSQFGHILIIVYESCQKLGWGLSAHETGLSPPVTVSYWPFQVGASGMAHICKTTSGLVLVILRCQDSASRSAGSSRPSSRYIWWQRWDKEVRISLLRPILCKDNVKRLSPNLLRLYDDCFINLKIRKTN